MFLSGTARRYVCLELAKQAEPSAKWDPRGQGEGHLRILPTPWGGLPGEVIPKLRPGTSLEMCSLFYCALCFLLLHVPVSPLLEVGKEGEAGLAGMSLGRRIWKTESQDRSGRQEGKTQETQGPNITRQAWPSFTEELGSVSSWADGNGPRRACPGLSQELLVQGSLSVFPQLMCIRQLTTLWLSDHTLQPYQVFVPTGTAGSRRWSLSAHTPPL